MGVLLRAGVLFTNPPFGAPPFLHPGLPELGLPALKGSIDIP